jgi:hypothetical protein
VSLAFFVGRWPCGSRPPRAGAGRHAGRPFDPDNPTSSGATTLWRADGQFKLANLHLALELDRAVPRGRAAGPHIVVDPGFANTDLQARSVWETGGRASQRLFHAAVRRFGMSPPRASAS